MAKPLYKNLTFQVVLAIVIGLVIGIVDPGWGVALKPLGDGFIRLIKMVVGPIVFLTIVCGIASMGDMKKVGRVGGKALLYFEVVTTIALAIGLLVANIMQPGTVGGKGIAESVQTDLSASQQKSLEGFVAQGKKSHTFTEFVLNIIPEQVVGAFAQGDLLQILFFSVIFGLAMSSLGLKSASLLNVFEQATEVMFRIVAMIMKIGPIGAMGAIAYTVGAFGAQSIIPLLKLLACVYLTMIIFIVLVLGSICWWYRISLWQYLRYIREEIVLVLGTSSSESALPRMIEKLELMGCGKGVVDLVIPTGYSFNLDGTSIYLSMALLFLAQAYGVTLTWTEQLYAMAILMLTSKGAAAVTGGGFITLSATLNSLDMLPSDSMNGLALLYGVDRFMSMARALTNLIGNGVAAIVVSKMEDDFDERRYHAAMAGHALEVPPQEGFSPEVMGDIANDPDSVDPPVGAAP